MTIDARTPDAKEPLFLPEKTRNAVFVVAHGIMPVRAAAIGLSLIYAAIV